MPKAVEECCRETYEETRTFYEKVSPQLGSCALGFRILYGPPIFEAPVLFIGYQPGGTVAHVQDHQGWPEICDYAVAEWRLASRLREIFAVDQLARSTGLNAVFFRAPNVEKWRRVPLPLRKEIESFCHLRAKRIIDALRPRQVVSIGLRTFDSLVPATAQTVSLRGSGDKVLAKEARLGEWPAVGIPHLSGDRIRNDDRDRLKEFLNSKIPF